MPLNYLLKPRTRLFISYRRADTGFLVGRIYDHLERYLDTGSVFLDVDQIPPGVDFRNHLDRAFADCTAALILIGTRWLERTPDGSLRLDEDGDFVRLEIEAVLARNIPVVPVRVAGASLPAPNGLPLSLRALLDRQAAPLDPGDYFGIHLDKLIAGLRDLDVVQRTKGYTRCLFSPDGATLALVGQHGTLEWWDVPSYNPRYTYIPNGSVDIIAFAADSRKLALISNQYLTIVDLFSNQAFAINITSSEGKKKFLRIAFNPGDSLAATVGPDSSVIDLWDTSRWEHRGCIDRDDHITSIAFAKQGGILAMGHRDGTIAICDLMTGRGGLGDARHNAPVAELVFANDGRTLASSSSDGEIFLWDARKVDRRLTLPCAARGNGMAFSSDGGLLATGASDNQVIVWSAHSGVQWSGLRNLTAPLSSVAFSPDNRTLICTCQDGTLCFFPVRTLAMFAGDTPHLLPGGALG